MSLDLVDYLCTGEDSPRLWIDFNAYARELLLAEGENPWTSPAAYISFYGQAHGLVKADVVTLNVWDLFQHWMREDKGAIPSMAGKRRVTAALKVMLAAYPPRELLAEVITAMSNNYGGNIPIILVMPSPKSLLVKAHKAANGVDVEPDEMNIDTASMYVADYLRYFSTTDLSGVLLTESPALMPASGAEIGWYQPIFNVAGHYRWSVGIQLPVMDKNFEIPAAVDFSISPAHSEAGPGIRGVDITQSLWEGRGTGGAMMPEKGFYYLSIPAGLKPESVLETLSKLRGD